VWDYDFGNTYDEYVPYSPEMLVELKEQWDDTCGISGAMAVCLPLIEVGDTLHRELMSAIADDDDDELPF
jgi:hypothetical protein